MGKLYHIREGFSLRTATGDVYLGGGVVELDAAQVAANAHKLEAVTPEQQAAFDAEYQREADAAAQVDAQADAKRKASLDEAAALAALAAAAAEAAAKQG